jgi:hypothetical protein
MGFFTENSILPFASRSISVTIRFSLGSLETACNALDKMEENRISADRKDTHPGVFFFVFEFKN